MKMHVAGRWLVVVLAIAPIALPALDGVAAPLHRPRGLPVVETAVDSASLSDLPLAAQAQISAVLGRDQSSYHAVPQAGGFRVANSKHGLAAEFTPAAVRVRAGTASWGLSLLGYGYSDAPSAATAVAPQAAANRVEYRRGDLTEWYLNGPLGLEQGFTLAKAPGKSTGEPLTLAFKLSGNLIASADATGKDAILGRADGTAALRYRGLTAHDAAGRALRSWLQVEGERLMLRVDDTGARYPLVVDPFIEQARLFASDGAAGDRFGGVALDGDTLVVGAGGDDVDGKVDQGSAYVFVKAAGGWSEPFIEQARLIASDGAANDVFGSVAVSGDTIVVGANGCPDANVCNTQPVSAHGSAYVFVKPVGGWSGTLTEQAKLIASDGASNDLFGTSVAVEGDTIVVAADWDDFFRGSAYVFVKPGGGWSGIRTQNAKLVASDRGTCCGIGNVFGRSKISGDTIVVGALGMDIAPFTDAGQAYVFVKPAGGWTGTVPPRTENVKLRASDRATNDRFGASVAIKGDTIAIGSPQDDVGVSATGSAYVFVKPPGGWTGTPLTERAKLIASDRGANDILGTGVLIVNDDTVIATAPAANSALAPDAGAAYLFRKPAGGWSPTPPLTESEKLTASDGATGDRFASLSMSGYTLVVGAGGDDVDGHVDQGSVYVFLREGLPATLTLTPGSAETPVGTTHTVTAAVEDVSAQPVGGVIVRFTVTGSVTASGDCTTDAAGACSFTYMGPAASGSDDITAFADTDGNGVRHFYEPDDSATKSWVADQDGDGVPDALDNCPAVPNAGQADTDGDGLGDACDACPSDPLNDADADGVCGNVDNCPSVANPDQANGDGDALGDACDACPADPANDADGDGVCGNVDNCPLVANPDQANGDGDALGDACDACPSDPLNDADADGVCGNVDNCPVVANPDQANGDGDALGDACDACPADPANDADGDGVCGNVDNCPTIPNAGQADGDGDGQGDACDACPADPANDADGDGVCGNVDNCPAVANPDQADADGDGLGNACDSFVNFGFRGLLPPYAAPPRRFKGNRTIPLKWQYTGADGSVVGSPGADPTVTVQGPVPCGQTTNGEVLDVSAAGDSGYQYDGDTATWQFNWKTQGVPSGCYYIQVTSAQAQASPLFPIQLE